MAEFSATFFNTTPFGAVYWDGKFDRAGVDWVRDGTLQALKLKREQFVFMAYAGADGRTLEYARAALFVNAIGGASSKEGTAQNGQTNLGTLRQAFSADVWPKMPGGLGLSVIDSNEAHHLSLLLAERAFRNPAAPDRPRVVVNFDKHQDWGGTVRPDGLRCSTWGGYSVAAVGDIYPAPLAQAYASIGPTRVTATGPESWNGSNAWLAGSPEIPVASVLLPASDPAVLTDQLIGEVRRRNEQLRLPAPTGLDLYLTVDRDIEQGSFTDYGDGSYAAGDVWDFIAQFISAMSALNAAGFEVRFAGFDICGLPTFGGSGTGTPARQNLKYEQAWWDLGRFAEIIRAIP